MSRYFSRKVCELLYSILKNSEKSLYNWPRPHYIYYLFYRASQCGYFVNNKMAACGSLGRPVLS